MSQFSFGRACILEGLGFANSRDLLDQDSVPYVKNRDIRLYCGRTMMFTLFSLDIQGCFQSYDLQSLLYAHQLVVDYI